VVAVSETLGQEARKQGVPKSKLAVVPNGVPCRRVLPARPTPQGTWTLGTVALMRPRKGIEVLLWALAALRREGLSVRWRAVGEFESPDYQRSVRGLAESLGLTVAVDWVGFTTAVDAELDRMDLFVLPSLFGEGMPMVVLEAMASGVPVVATRVEGIPEAVRHGREGLLVPPDDAAELAQAIARFVTGQVDWQTLRSNAYHRQREKFSAGSMAAGVAAVYRRVLGVLARRGAMVGKIYAH
jgi:glycosyltransferase involved in cell wall biosynthesis